MIEHPVVALVGSEAMFRVHGVHGGYRNDAKNKIDEKVSYDFLGVVSYQLCLHPSDVSGRKY